MQKFTKLSLTTLATLILAACSSSGGDDNGSSTSSNSSETEQSSSQTNSNTTNNSSSSSNSSTSSNTRSGSGVAFRISDSEVFNVDQNSDYKNTLIVDGKTLPIGIMGISSGGFTKLSGTKINGVTYAQLVVSGTKFSNTKFGVVDGYVFAQGNTTSESEIPTTGTATYNVDGVLVVNDEVTTSTGNTLTADFANKTVNGTVFDGVSVNNATIKGSTISGTANYNGTSAALEGNFYGSNASEVGGAYSSSSFSGAFGGKQ